MKTWLRQSAQIDMEAEADRAHPLETGGVLIGYATRNGLVVERIVGPGPMATATRTSFLPDTAFQQSELNRIYQLSAGKETYLGDWHSHPDGVPARPSQDDEILLNTVHRKMSVEGLPALMVIVASNEVSFIVRYEEAV